MKTKTKWILGLSASLPLVIGLAGFMYFNYFFAFDIDFFNEGPTTEVNLAGWQHLEKGMTKPQTIALLGDAPSKSGPSRTVSGGETNTTQEVWAYNWTIGLFSCGEVHPRAYAVYFDEEEKVASWREPLEKEETPEPNL